MVVAKKRTSDAISRRAAHFLIYLDTNRDNRDLKSCTLPFIQKDNRVGRSTEMSKHLFVTYILFDTTLNVIYILFNTKSSMEKNVSDEEI